MRLLDGVGDRLARRSTARVVADAAGDVGGVPAIGSSVAIGSSGPTPGARWAPPPAGADVVALVVELVVPAEGGVYDDCQLSAWALDRILL